MIVTICKNCGTKLSELKSEENGTRHVNKCFLCEHPEFIPDEDSSPNTYQSIIRSARQYDGTIQNEI